MTNFVAPGFEALQGILASYQGLDGGGAAFSAYVDGKLVVDIKAGVARPGVAWSDDTLAVLMSTTKAFAGFCMNVLADMGELDVDEKVAHYWPEFAANGKADVTVRQILLHTSGVIGIDNSVAGLKWNGDGWTDLDAIAAGLAASSPAWKPGTHHGYHAVTYGWLTGEIVRRISGISLGQFFAKQAAGPLGLDTYIGATPEQIERVAHVVEMDSADAPRPLRVLLNLANKRMVDPNTLLGKAFLGDGKDSIMSKAKELINDGSMLVAEVPSSNGISTAQSLARFFAALSMGGELDGTRIISEQSLRDWSREQTNVGDYVVAASVPVLAKLANLENKTKIRRALGYCLSAPQGKKPAAYGPNPAAFGCEGAGGQVGYADPTQRVGVGFVRSSLRASDDLCPQLVKALYEAIPG